MDEPIAPVDTIDQALLAARAAIAELKRPRPGETAVEARSRSVETIKAQRRLIEASRKSVAGSVAAARKVGMKAASDGRANGKATTSAPQLTLVDAVEVCLQLAERALAEVRAVERRIVELRPMSYEGVWDAEKTYAVGQFCTDDGSLWHCCTTSTGVRPGSAAGVWQLAVKRGRDGRDRK